MDTVPQWMLAQQLSASGPVDTVADYYLSHPNGRVIASFFLGGAFMHALHYLFSSTWVRGLLGKVRSTIYSPIRSRCVKVDPENPATLTMSEKGGFTREKSEDLVESQSIRQYNDHSSLIFVLNLCLLLATFTLFLTLLAFRNGWQTGCTFVVAWGGMSSQVARLLGMLILILELTTMLGMRKMAVWGLRVMLVVALGE
ncbi:hypothetical protein BDY19DRAFT_136428 [Irpex rosettiformis]|uniref:Uncharacterized protein n=1 Tax=Irpex rosettiformis TaxID=378272 RepID=A0ACB8U5P6_9APHY|nr:hypothetical protein BDY19DRAFT_136428 [Irpex rosettiformis]